MATTRQHGTPPLTGMSVEFLECRDYGHAWRTARLEAVDRHLVARRAVCLRCEMERTEDIDFRTGVIVTRKYRPPRGYRLVGYGRVDKADFRLAYVRSQDLSPNGGGG